MFFKGCNHARVDPLSQRLFLLANGVEVRCCRPPFDVLGMRNACN